jgi:uncharacterized repeat protein (TIGR03837 family)
MTSTDNSQPKTCDIFCAVVDNFGDIGVSWRLARQLANEHGIHVRLWVDDLPSFAKLCPETDASQKIQIRRQVEVRNWDEDFPEAQPAELVIEAFACKLPETYIEAMAAQEHQPVWLNLEYLSAEGWVEGCHKLPSPHPQLPLTKYFFFPGFTGKTGGLLLERDLIARRDAFQSVPIAQKTSLTPTLSPGEREFWRSLEISVPAAGELRISLFSYENENIAGLFNAWSLSATPLMCLVPEGRVLPQVAAFFGQISGKAGDSWQHKNLRVHVLPFVEQERYDELLWACDINFVRGEDSCVRAQWAGRPFVWHIYPQHDGVHMQKLKALSGLYGRNLPAIAHQVNENLWLAWNGEGDISTAWPAYATQLVELKRQARTWSAKLANNNLALNLLDFFSQVGKIRAFKI